MSGFWDQVLGPPQPNPVVSTSRGGAWWQDDDPYGQLQRQDAPQGYYPPGYGQQHEEAVVQRLRKVRGAARNLSPDEAEMIARYDLDHKAKYHVHCPQCGSGNYIPAGTRVNGVTMPTERCFECGLAARSPDMAIGGAGGGGLATRQIDTGGGAGPSMYMAFQQTPKSYLPRGG